MAAEPVGSIFVSLKLEIGKFLEGIQKATGGLKSVGQKMAGIGKELTAKVTAPVVALGAGVLQTAADFEAGMNRVRGITGATGDDFTRLQDLAKELGRTTQFSAAEAAAGMEFLAKAGFDVNQVLTAMPATLNLAAAANLGLGEAADIASNILSGFGMDASDLADVVDDLAATSTNANTDVRQLGEAMKYVGPVAAAAGQEFDQTLAILGKMGDAGIQASMAGTALRGAISRLLNPTAEVAAKLEELGVVVTDSSGKLRPMVDIVRDLEDSGASAGDVMSIFGDRAGPALQSLISQGADSIDVLTGKIRDAGPAAQRLADVQMSGLSGAIKAMKSALEGLAIAIADAGLLQWATGLVQQFTGLIQRLTTTNPELLRMGTAVAGIAAAAGPLLIILGKLVVALSNLVPAIQKVGGAFVAVIRGLDRVAVKYLALVGIAATVALALVGSWNDIQKGVKAATDFIVRVIAGFMKWLANNFFLPMLTAIGELAEKHIPGLGKSIKSFADDATRSLRQFVIDADRSIQSFANEIARGAGAATDAIGGFAETVGGEFFDRVKRGLDITVGFVEGRIPDILGAFGSLVPGVSSVMDDLDGETEAGMGTIFRGIENWMGLIRSLFSQDWGRIISDWKEGAQELQRQTETALAAIADTFRTIFGNIADVVGHAMNQIVGKVDQSVSPIKGAVERIKAEALDILDAAVSTLAGNITDALFGGGSITQAFADAAESILKNVVEKIIEQAIYKLIDAILHLLDFGVGLQSFGQQLEAGMESGANWVRNGLRLILFQLARALVPRPGGEFGGWDPFEDVFDDGIDQGHGTGFSIGGTGVGTGGVVFHLNGPVMGANDFVEQVRDSLIELGLMNDGTGLGP